MKKCLALLCITCLLIMGLTACNQKKDESKEEKKEASKQTEQKSEEKSDQEADKKDEAQGNSAGEKMFTVAMDFMPSNLHSDFGQDSMTVIVRPIYDPLIAETKDGFEYYIADKVDISEDRKTYTVHIADKATWSDGQPITVDDLLFSIKYAERKSGSSDFSVFQDQKVQANKKDDKTLEFVLPVPNNLFPYRLANLNVLPSHAFPDGDVHKVDESGYFFKPGMATSGPYTVEAINEDSIVYKARKDYHRGTPKVETVVMKLMGLGSARKIAFESGELSYMRVTTAEELNKYREQEDKYNIFSVSESRINYFQLNPNGPMMKDLSKDARKAIFLALNQQEILDIAYGSDELVQPAKSILTKDQTLQDPSCPGYKHDLEEAKKLAESSGLVGKKLIYIYNADRVNMEAIATVIQHQLSQIGVQVEVEGLDAPTFFSRFFAPYMGTNLENTWDLGTNGWDSQRGGSIVQPSFYLNNAYAWGWSQEIVDLTNKINVTGDKEEEKKLAYELQNKSLEEYWLYPLTDTNFVMVTHKNITGLDGSTVVPEFSDYLTIEVK